MSRQGKSGGKKSIQYKSTVYDGDVTLADFANSTAIDGKLKKPKTSANLVHEVKKLSIQDKARDDELDDKVLKDQKEGRPKKHPNNQLSRHSANSSKIVPTKSAEKVEDFKKEVEGTKTVKKVNDNMEQYRLRNNLLIHGLEEKVGEKTVESVLDMFRNHLQIYLITKDIIKAERIDKQFLSGKHRPILVTFATHSDRNKVYYTKKKLKGSCILIVEDLTPQRLELFQRVVKVNGLKNTWTTKGGRVMWIDNKGIKHSAIRLKPLKKDLPN